MSPSSPSLPARERAELADLLDQLGPDAPTCCTGWTTAHLAAHLVVRDRRPDAMPGFGLEGFAVGRPLGQWSHHLEGRLRESTPYAEVVGRVRSGPPGWLPTGWPRVDRVLNTAEYAIHHEDARRAQPGWTPRDLPRSVQDQLWANVAFFGRRAAGRLPGGLVLRRTDVPGAEKRVGSGATTVEGEPMELLLWASGRERFARVTVSSTT
jgi:uncharacterized protein (TIGR03085 family)